MVEMAVLETASENLSSQLSTSVVITFYSLGRTPDNGLSASVALLCVTDYRAVIRSHLLLLDAPLRTAVLP